MELYPRRLDLQQLLSMKSFFLFGPRATGKTTLIRQQLPGAHVYDLLDAEVYRRLLVHPRLIVEEHPEPDAIVVIDEVQKLPMILDEVHRLVETKGHRFLLTGSSARKVKRGAANLLAGRAWEASLFPLSWSEIPDFDLMAYLNTGGLPAIYGSAHPREELRSYVNLYLREEIQAEALTRNLPGFARFLDTVALANGEEINYQSLSSDCGVPARTLHNYVQILKDTLVAFTLEPFRRTRKRKAISRHKLFLFDVGVVNSLCRRGHIEPRSELFGLAFEHFIVGEIRAFLSYERLDFPLQYWRSTSQFEVDVVIGDELALEIKATSLVGPRDLKGLRALAEEGMVRRYAVVSLDPTTRTTEDGIAILPWAEFLRSLWSGALLA